ncbi:MAG TPA: YebC/PmpR family DNA-binding transcriptional regulator [Candidatus Paceibacterota bacterium]|jgi:YebC/PmpR family DNA-binding regulatory protein
MAGHSKWAQIKRQKGVTDAARSRTFSKFARLITIESKKTGGQVTAPSLAAVIARAKAVNMPKDNIERAVAKGASKEANDLEQVVYEFYGPSGAAVIVNALTDNKNRTTAEIKHMLSKNGYELGTPGSAVWAFSKGGGGSLTPNEPLMDVSGDDEERLGNLLELLDEHEDVQDVVTNARGYESTSDEE